VIPYALFLELFTATGANRKTAISAVESVLHGTLHQGPQIAHRDPLRPLQPLMAAATKGQGQQQPLLSNITSVRVVSAYYYRIQTRRRVSECNVARSFTCLETCAPSISNMVRSTQSALHLRRSIAGSDFTRDLLSLGG
jgi:hypothetical protein